MLVSETYVRSTGGYAALKVDQPNFQVEFCRLVSCEQTLGRCLDIGCGGGFAPYLSSIEAKMEVHDGVDPSEAVLSHPTLSQRWHGAFESVDVPSGAYDSAFAYNVLEHIADPASFCATLHRVLKPGGRFFALTPHGRHPFSKCVRIVQALGLRSRAVARSDAVNDYDAYYRLNSPKSVLRYVNQGTGWSRADFYLFPNLGWQNYFPGPMRALGKGYDRLIGSRFASRALIFAMRLEKGPA